jgi:single-stranded-DNA-specific exonuclease
MPGPVARTLVHRGRVEDADLDAFLNPRLASLADPMVLADMDRAVERMWRAVDGGETVFVHGDYDVDGVTGTAFLTRTLRALGARVVPFVPRRADGYGVGDAGIAAAVDSGATLLVTVDTGVQAFAAVAAAGERGLDVVILDHHEPAATLPDAVAVVNPMRGPVGGPFRELAAVGVAAKFVHGMAAARPGDAVREAYREALQLVALGTIADVVPMTGENRILVAHGLRELSRSRWAGIQALKALAGLTGPRVSSTDVAFFVAPRINAAGRMGEAGDALALLLADDPAEAYRLAERIEGLNTERRRVEQLATAEAADALRGRDPIPAAVVQWSETWPRGVVGIVAGRILDRFHRPAFIIALDGEGGRGSARSRPAFPLPAALADCGDLLQEHGGHAEAAGFSIRRENLEPFRERMERLAGDGDWSEEPDPWDVDTTVDLEEVDADCARWVDRLSPFGRGNPEPLFGCEKMPLAGPPSVVGKRHLRVAFTRGSATVRGIAFNQGDRIGEFEGRGRMDAVFHVAMDWWRGNGNVQLVIRDMNPR